MLDFEDENRDLLANAFDFQLKCARDLLALGQEFGESLTQSSEERRDEFDPVTWLVVIFVFAQLLRRCRGVILLWEFGYVAESEVLARSLFDTHLAARFIIETQVPQSHWSYELQKEFEDLCSLCGNGITRFTDMNFRATLYAASRTLKFDKKTEILKALPILKGVLPEDFGDKMRLAASDVENEIGNQWAKRIRKTKTFHGFSKIKLLAEYCGADKDHYYRTLYGLQSESTHGENALALTHQPTRTVFQNTLCVPCAIFGSSIDDFNRVFSLGYTPQLTEMCIRIRNVFQTEPESENDN